VTLRAALGAAGILVATAVPARGQTVVVWPEVDLAVRLGGHARLLLVATNTRDGGERTDGEFGASLDLHLKPIRRPPKLLFRLDDAKNRRLTITSAYRYLPSYADGPAEHRALLEATVRYPVRRYLGDVLISNRNRIDFRVIDGTYSWRYRNRLSAERELSIGPVRVNPYSRFEVFYDSRFGAFSKTELMLGGAFPINRFWELEGYYDWQFDTGKSPNRKTRAIGLVTTFYF
jgi:hypothetical protein